MGSNQGFVPSREDTVGTTVKDNRLFVEAVLYRYQAGIPECFGDFCLFIQFV